MSGGSLYRHALESLQAARESTARYGLKIQNLAAAFQLKAERRAGDLLAALERNRVGNGPISPDSVSGESAYRHALDTLHIDERSAQRWQEVARVPVEVFDEYVEPAKRDERVGKGDRRWARRVPTACGAWSTPASGSRFVAH